MTTVWILARTLSYLEGGGNFWVYLNWALGLKECGCHVVWLETVPQEPDNADQIPIASTSPETRVLRAGFSNSVVLA